MNKVRSFLFLATLLSVRSAFAADPAQFGSGNMHFDVKEMDANHDGMISKDEFMKYGEAKWDKMAKGNAMMSVADATKDFSRGNMHPAP